MAEWDAEQYVKFKLQRTQPAVDLARRIEMTKPGRIVDVGCGPGNSTRVLRDLFPNASIVGLDSSKQMITKARETCPDIAFKVVDIAEDIRELENSDIIFSNACLQWVPNHKKLIPRLFGKLRKGGVLAVQIPVNLQEKLFTIMSEIIETGKWDFSSIPQGANATLPCEEYFDLLSSLTDTFTCWETVYYHKMPSVEAMVEWVKGARLRPYLAVLSDNEAKRFINEIMEKADRAYASQKNGEIIFKFRRFFFTATR